VNPNIRNAEPQDFDPVMRLYRELQPKDPVLTNGNDRRAFTAILETPGLHLLVYDTGTELAGTSYLNIIPNISRAAAPYAVVENVVTLEKRRQQGIGYNLMQHTLGLAWEQGCYKVMLQTGSTRASTHRFYKRCGFRTDQKTGFVARPPMPTHD
jgi:GNAT superfamily N-acetyltransferase